MGVGDRDMADMILLGADVRRATALRRYVICLGRLFCAHAYATDQTFAVGHGIDHLVIE